jgi:hypothetical protein
MNIEDMSYFLATQGYSTIHFYDAMEFNNLASVEDAIKLIYNQKFGKDE